MMRRMLVVLNESVLDAREHGLDFCNRILDSGCSGRGIELQANTRNLQESTSPVALSRLSPSTVARR